MPYIDYSLLEIFLNNDQPATCPYCSWRTDFDDIQNESKTVQLLKCLNLQCGFVFICEDDKELMKITKSDKSSRYIHLH